MAKIPTYQAPTVQSNTGPVGERIQTFPVSEVGASIAGAGESFMRLGVEALRKENAVRVDSELASFNDYGNEALSNPTKGAFAKQGKYAVGIASTTSEELRKQMEAQAHGLANDAQRREFRARAAPLLSQWHGQLNRHEYQEADHLDQETTKAGIDSFQQGASNHYNDPDALMTDVAYSESILERRGERAGWSPEILSSAKQAARSGIYVSALDQFRDNESTAAHAYFEAHKDEIDPKNRARLAHNFEIAGDTEMAESLAAKAFQTGSLTAGNDEIQDTKDVPQTIKNAAKTSLEEKFNDQAKQAAIADQSLKTQADPYFKQGGFQVSAIPSKIRGSMSSDLYLAYERVQNQRLQEIRTARRFTIDDADPVDLAAYYDAMDQPDEVLSNYDFFKSFAGKVPPALIAQGQSANVAASRRIVAFRQGQDQELAKHRDDDIRKSAFLSMAIESKMLSTDDEIATKDQKASYVKTTAQAAALVSSEEAAKKRRLTDPEIRDLTKHLFMKGRLSKNWASDPETFVGESFGDPNFYLKEPGDLAMTDVERGQVIDALKAKGIEPTDDAIRDLFIRTKARLAQ